MVTESNVPEVLTLRPLIGVWEDASGLVIETDDERVRLSGVAAETAATLISRIDGRRSMRDLLRSNEPGVTAKDRALLDALMRSELVVGGGSGAGVQGAEAADRFAKAFVVWNARIFSHPLWSFLVEGNASRALVSGWVLETYHFIRGASARLPLAIAHCPPGPQRDVLSGHFAEEYDHDALFLQSLDALGIDATAARAAPPLPGTLAVIDAMREAARQDVLAYAGCSGLLESTGSDAARGRHFYDLLAQRYGELGDFVTPMRRHVELDEGFGHGSVMAQVFQLEGLIEGPRLDRVAATVHAFVETLEFWFDDIHQHYAPLTTFRPGGVRRYRAAQPALISPSTDLRPAAPEECRPLISPAAEMEVGDDLVRIEDAHEALTYTGPSADVVQHAVPHMEGRLDLSVLAETVGVPKTVLSNHLAPLFDAGLAVDAGRALRAETPADFAEALNAEACFWNRAYFARPLLRRLFDGRASRAEVFGWGVEFTHFVRGANRYMAAGVAHCDPSSTWLTPLAEHFAEEWSHASIFLDGLADCGLDPAAVATCQPSAETSALLDRFAEIGRRSTIGYAALFAFMRPLRDNQPLEEDLALMGRLSEAYPYARGLFEALTRHGSIDRELGHGAAPVFALIREVPRVSRRDRIEAVAAVRSAWEGFAAIAAGIERRFGPSAVFHLRRPACFRSLPGAT